MKETWIIWTNCVIHPAYIGRKAGMPYDEWKKNGLEFEKFQAEVFGEESPGGEVRRM